MDTKNFKNYLKSKRYSDKTILLYFESIRNQLPSFEILDGEDLYQKCLLTIDMKKTSSAFDFIQTRASIRQYFEMRTGVAFNKWNSLSREETPLDIFLKKFSIHLKSFLHLSESVSGARVSVARRFISWAKLDQDSDDWSSIDPNTITDFLENSGHLTSAASKNTISTHIKSLIDYAAFIGKKTTLSITKLPLHSKLTIYTKKTKAFDKSEIEKLEGFYCKDNEKDTRNYAIILSLTDLGLRTCEVCNLTLDSVNWEEGTIRIWSPKTKKERILPLTVRLGNALENYIIRYRPKIDSKRIFLMIGINYGKPMDTEAIRRVVRYAISKIGIKGYWVGPHSIRRYFGTELYSADSGLKKVADILGHDCITTTSSYVRLNIEGLRKSVACDWPSFGGDHE